MKETIVWKEIPESEVPDDYTPEEYWFVEDQYGRGVWLKKITIFTDINK